MGFICLFEFVDDVVIRLLVWCKYEIIGIWVYGGGKVLYCVSWFRVGIDIIIVYFLLIYLEICRVREKKIGFEWI